jgi:hypothetical protein
MAASTVCDVGAAVAHHPTGSGFEAPYVPAHVAILTVYEAVLHLWGATDGRCTGERT